MVNIVLSFKQKVFDLLGLAAGITQDPDENQKRKRDLAKKFVHDGLRAKGFDVDRALLKEKPKKEVKPHEPDTSETKAPGDGNGAPVQKTETSPQRNYAPEGPVEENEEETEEIKEGNDEPSKI